MTTSASLFHEYTLTLFPTLSSVRKLPARAMNGWASRVNSASGFFFAAVPPVRESSRDKLVDRTVEAVSAGSPA